MTDSNQQYDILIVGAGLIGAACALSLAKNTDFSIAVVERSPPISENPQANQRVVALGQIAMQVLQDIGVFAELAEESCHSYHKMFIWDENSHGELSLNAQDHQLSELGHMIDSVQCNLLLQRKMKETPSIDLFYGLALQELGFTDQFVCLSSSGKMLKAKLLVAADGSKSWVRQRAKIFAPVQDYKQKGIVATIRTAQPHLDTAWQRFLATGPIAVLPLSDNQSSIVWSADTEYAAQLMTLSDSEFEAVLAKALEQKLGAVELLSSRMLFPLQSIKADIYCKKRLVLIGDAAHSIHPLAGQGANLGFKDIVSLTQALQVADDSSLGNLGILQKYQRARQLDNKQTDLLMTALQRGFKNASPLLASIRGQGMNVISANQTLKKLLIMAATGE